MTPIQQAELRKAPIDNYGKQYYLPMSRGTPRVCVDQVSEFNRERIVAYRDCRLSFRKLANVLNETK
ncbi:hypothetical protein TNCV_5108551 [Trichonephila clavipes]|nr:hypothetical protein TNCV_5108551 [Trichonephila clavipes]